MRVIQFINKTESEIRLQSYDISPHIFLLPDESGYSNYAKFSINIFTLGLTPVSLSRIREKLERK